MEPPKMARRRAGIVKAAIVAAVSVEGWLMHDSPFPQL
jgi:hypothetical protein